VPPRRGLKRALTRTLLALLTGATAAACISSPSPLEDTSPSPLALGNEVLAAVRRGNPAGLRRLAMQEREFRELVWPYLPASRPERNLSFGYVWGDLAAKSEAHLRTLAAGFQDRPGLEVTGVRFAGASDRYGSVVIHRDTRLTVRDGDGRQYEVRLFGSTLEQTGRYKVFSWVVD
jgi:hypothetical protein